MLFLNVLTVSVDFAVFECLTSIATAGIALKVFDFFLKVKINLSKHA